MNEWMNEWMRIIDEDVGLALEGIGHVLTGRRGRRGRAVFFVIGLGAVASAVAQLHIADQLRSSATRELDVSATIIHHIDQCRMHHRTHSFICALRFHWFRADFLLFFGGFFLCFSSRGFGWWGFFLVGFCMREKGNVGAEERNDGLLEKNENNRPEINQKEIMKKKKKLPRLCTLRFNNSIRTRNHQKMSFLIEKDRANQ